MPSSETVRGLLEQVRASDPGAATPLYDRFAPGLRALMGHKLPGADPDTCVFHVLVTVARAVRKGEVHDENDLTARVRAAANAFIEEVSPGNKTRRSGPVQKSRQMLGRLEPDEREILARTYLLAQSEHEIGEEMKIPAEIVGAVKQKARKWFLASNRS